MALKKRKDRSQTQITLQYYHWVYATALSIIAVISIISQILIQSYLSNQEHDSHLINYAARLRTNSQMLTKLALLLESERDYETNRKDFKTTMMQWSSTHEGLLKGNEFLSLPVNKNEDMAELFKIIDGPYTNIMFAAREIVNKVYSDAPFNPKDIKNQIQTILDNEKPYLLGMEMIVFDYDRISRSNVEYLKRVERVLLTVILVMLLLEALFIFRPLASRIQIVFNELIQAESNATSLADELSETNRILENSHNELREFNYALEKAAYMVRTDNKGIILYANDKYCHVTKYPMSNLVGKPLFYNNMGNEESVIYRHINSLDRNREVWQGEIFDHASDGTGFWLDVTLMPLINHKGILHQYLVIGTDITKRKKTERKLHLLSEEKIKRQQEEQKIRSQSIIAGQEKERKRVAVEIHDGIGQMLTSVRMRLEMLEDENPQAFNEITDVYRMIQSIVAETRRICVELQPHVLEDFGLKAAINDLVEEVNKSTSLAVDFRDGLEEMQAAPELEIGIYRILQEALNNVTKHAKAKQLFVRVESDAEFITLEIKDDGVGFDYNAAMSKNETGNTHGLTNMQERAELLGASFEINSRVGTGTTIRLETPV